MSDRPNEADCLEQISRILRSRTFRNTEVLKRMLDYLGRKALAGEAHQLKEYVVGVEAFGKNDSYDPKTDSLVRVQAGKLRQRLEEYYRTEGASDRLTVELPRGQFELEFRENVAAVAPARGAETTQVAGVATIADRGMSRGATLPWLLAILSAGVAVGAVVVSIRRRPAAAAHADSVTEGALHPAVAHLWRPFLGAGRTAAISLGTPMFARIGDSFLRVPAIGDWGTLSASKEVKLLSREKILSEGEPAPAHIYTGVGEAWGAFELARVFSRAGKELKLIPSNALTWEDIGHNNVIFLGSPKYNLQTRDLPMRQDFVIERGRILNLRPLPGEPATFDEYHPLHQKVTNGHALVARLPGLHGTGYIMLLASTTTEGTRAAVEYMTRPDYAQRLVGSLRRPDGELAPYFQAVVKVRFKDQTPIHVEQVAIRLSADK